MWRAFITAVILTSCAATSTATPGAPGPEPEPAPAPAVAETPEPPEDPPAQGASLLIEQRSCVYPCPTYRYEVFANGRVQWEGMLFVSAVGERVFSIDPAAAQRLFDAWHDLDLETVPRTYGQATDHPHLTPRRTLYSTAEGASTERYQATYMFSNHRRSNDDTTTAAGIDAMAEVLDAFDATVGLDGLIAHPRCKPFTYPFASELSDTFAADSAANHYTRSGGADVVWVVAFDRDRPLAAALEARKALFEAGVPNEAVKLRLIRANPENARLGWGWIATAPAACFSHDGYARTRPDP